MLRLAVQKSGRLTDPSLKLLGECGIEFERSSSKLRIPAYNFPVEIMSFRDDDIPAYVEEGVVDAAIVGENIVNECARECVLVRKLGFGRCRLSIALAKDGEYVGPESLSGIRIATSYPKILSRFLVENNVRASIHELSGSVEIAPSIGIAEAICDLVSSGSTLLSNGLKEVATLMESEAVLIASPKISKESEAALKSLDFRIASVLRARHTKYIMLNTLEERIPEIVKILPGLKSPSILPLAKEGWCSLHTVVDEDNFWTQIEKLKAAGAEGILVLPIEKVIS